MHVCRGVASATYVRSAHLKPALLVGTCKQQIKQSYLPDETVVMQGFPTPTDQRHCVNSKSLKFKK